VRFAGDKESRQGAAISLLPSVGSGGVECGDAGVDKWLLVGVNRFRWSPFGDAVVVDAAGPAAGVEVVVVMNAKQRKIIEISLAAVDPGNDVVAFAVLRRMGTSGK